MFLMAVSVVLVILTYTIASDARRAVNPADKLLPAPHQIVETAVRLTTQPDRRSGEIVFWNDTAAV